MNLQNKVLDEMELVSGIEDCDNNVLNNSATEIRSEIGTTEGIYIECSSSPSPGSLQPSSTDNHFVDFKDLETIPEKGVENNTSPIVQNLANCNKSEQISFETVSVVKSTTTSIKDGNDDNLLPIVQNLANCDTSEQTSIETVSDVKSTTTSIKDGNDDNLLPQKEQAMSASDSLKDLIKSDLPINCETVESSDCTPKKNKYDLITVCNIENIGQDLDNSEVGILVTKSQTNVDSQASSNIFCSTPIISEVCIKESNQTPKSVTNNNIERSRNNLKRKFFGLESIKEVDEDSSEVGKDKKIKYEVDNEISCSKNRCEDDISSSMSCYEAPATSILKKWQTNSLSRAGTSYFIVDECGGSDEEESQKNLIETNKKSNQDIEDDEFEIACKSLNEELMKSSSNIEALEKYYSQVQMENQKDDDQFDEVLQELTLTFGLGDETLLICEKERLASKADCSTLTPVKTKEMCESAKPNVLENEQLTSENTEKNASTVEDGNNTSSASTNKNFNLTDKIKDSTSSLPENKSAEAGGSKITTQLASVQSASGENNKTSLRVDGEDMLIGLDEEDVLLEEDSNTKAKPYEFHEYVSNDPEENNDNYNPEWKTLGQLTSDEERYKAVRDRWRSFIPPDPNRDLTCRQWRERNGKPTLKLPTRNNNHQMHTNNERNQLCTAVFQKKIKRVWSELDEARLEILQRRTMDFQELAVVQDRQQSNLVRRGGTMVDLNILRKRHIEECRHLKGCHDSELEKITIMTDEKIRILKDASEEVLLFQRFYKGFGAKDDDEICLYMTDMQVQELMETEEMLEQYSTFYSN